MNHLRPHPFFALPFAAAALLAFAACGGHSRGSSDSSSSTTIQTAPVSSSVASQDVSGTWATTLEGVALGTTTFSMASNGSLSGSLKTDTGDTGTISGHVSGSEAEYTVSFKTKAYLASVTFSDTNNASGSLVDALGHLHSMTLAR